MLETHKAIYHECRSCAAGGCQRGEHVTNKTPKKKQNNQIGGERANNQAKK
jgi:hypothetical protein